MIIVPNLSKNPRDLQTLNTYLVRTNGKELNNLHTPCYKPTMIKYMADLRKLTGITQKDMDIFFNSVTARFAADFKILKNDITAIIIIGIVYYSRIKRFDIAESLYILLAIRFYTNRVNLHWMKYCKPDIWELALRNISQKHLFKVRNGISSTILYLASDEYNKNKQRYVSTKLTDKEFIDLIYRLRHRVAQSVKSFANRYYDIEEDGQSKEDNKSDTKESINIPVLADSIANAICTYAQIDKKSLDTSIMRSRIRRDVAIEIIREISKVQFKDRIKFLIILMSKFINLKDVCTKQQFLVRKIVQNNQKIGPYSIKDEILKIIDETGIYSVKNLNKDQLTILLAFYITSFIQSKIC